MSSYEILLYGADSPTLDTHNLQNIERATLKRSGFPHIVMLLYGSLPIDTRVDREIRALAKKNFNITILDTEMGHGTWNGCVGARRIPIIPVIVAKRQSIGGLLRFWYSCFKYLYKNRRFIDAVHVHDLTGLPPAWLITKFVPRIKFIFDSHELFPEIAQERLSIFHYIMFLAIEMICARRIDYLISVSPVILQTIARRVGGIPVLLMNVPDLQRVKERLGKIPVWSKQSESSTRRIAYSGGVLHRRGYDELVHAAKILSEDEDHKYEFWIVGDGPYLDHIKSLVESLSLTNTFVFTGRVEFEELLSITSKCDVAVALYSEPMAHLGMSNKMFEYMMIGMPFLYPEAKQSLPILNQIRAVIVDNPVNVENLVESIISLFNDRKRMIYISENGRRRVMTRFNWAVESRKLIGIYNNLFPSE